MKLDVVRTQFGSDATNSILFIDSVFDISETIILQLLFLAIINNMYRYKMHQNIYKYMNLMKFQ